MLKKTPDRKCFQLDERQPYLKKSYRSLALVMERRHVEALEPGDDDTLIVSSNWLLWQECLQEQRHCVHADLGILGWDALELGNNHFMDIHDWVYVDGRDATLFHGVSLGRKFRSGTSLVMADYMKLKRSLQTLIERFSPEEVVFFDFRTDYGFLDREERFHILREVALERNLKVADREDTSGSSKTDFPTIQSYGFLVENRPSLKSFLKSASLAVFESFFSLLSICIRSLAPGRPTVFIAATALNGVPLLENFDGKGILPLYLARIFPNKRDFLGLINYVKKGGLLVGAGKLKLKSPDRGAVDEIERRLEAAWKTPADGVEGALRRYIGRNILGLNKFHKVAEDVLWAERLLERHKPDQIFTDGFMTPLSTTFLELAKARGIRTAAAWHAPIIQNVRFEVLGSNPKYPPLVDRLFTWGKAQEGWLDAISAKVETIRTGSPISGQQRPATSFTEKRQRVLVVQYFISYYNYQSPACHEYYFYVESIRMLLKLGYSQIRVKLHPGTKKSRYYKKIADYYGFECDICSSGAFKEHVAWADFVIGPPTSGTMLESMGMGKPHYAVMLPPSSIDMTYLEGRQVFSDFESLGRALSEGCVADQGAFLNNFISCDDISNPARRMWDALRDNAA
jgi:hypothetical protein